MNNAVEISNTLATFPLPNSFDAIAMEDLLVVSLFASRRLHTKNSHIPQILGKSFNHTGEMLHKLGSLFEDQKVNFNIKDSVEHLSAAISLTDALSTQRCFDHLDESKFTVLRWCIVAYAMVLDPASRVRLSVDRSLQMGFGLKARVNLKAEEEIWEAIGAMPGDKQAVSELSAITVASGQNQRKGSLRTLYGPLRMVNHRCTSFNAKFMSICGTSAFVMYATQDILAGDEITVNYGPKWFEGCCPCIDCQKSAQEKGRKKGLPDSPNLAGVNVNPSLLLALQNRRTFIEAEAQERVQGALKRNAEESLAREGENKRRKRCKQTGDEEE